MGRGALARRAPRHRCRGRSRRRSSSPGSSRARRCRRRPRSARPATGGARAVRPSPRARSTRAIGAGARWRWFGVRRVSRPRREGRPQVSREPPEPLTATLPCRRLRGDLRSGLCEVGRPAHNMVGRPAHSIPFGEVSRPRREQPAAEAHQRTDNAVGRGSDQRQPPREGVSPAASPGGSRRVV